MRLGYLTGPFDWTLSHLMNRCPASLPSFNSNPSSPLQPLDRYFLVRCCSAMVLGWITRETLARGVVVGNG